MRWFRLKRRPRITVEQSAHDAQRRMLEDLARRIGDRAEHPHASRRHTVRRRALPVLAVTVLALAGTAVAAAVLDVSLGVPALDRILRIEREIGNPIKPAPIVVKGSVTPPVAVPPGNGANGAVAVAFVDERHRLCIARDTGSTAPDRHTGRVGCATSSGVAQRLEHQPLFATGMTVGPTTVLVGFTQADVTKVAIRAPNGRDLNMALLKRVWRPPGTSAPALRVYVGAYLAFDGRLGADMLDQIIDPSRYRVVVQTRDGRRSRVPLR